MMLDPPSKGVPQQVTQILGAVTAGEEGSAADLLPLLYGELRKLAASRMARLGAGQTLQATALVHEAYMRLVSSTNPTWQGRAHFFAAAARTMRNILADELRRKHSLKHGGHGQRVGEDTAAEISCEGASPDDLAIEEALEEFEAESPRKAEVMTLTFFGGLTAVEIAEVLKVSTRTVERDLRFGKAWLNRRLTDPQLGP